MRNRTYIYKDHVLKKFHFLIFRSATTVKRRRRALNLTGSSVTTRAMLHQEAEQLVIAQLDKDPAKRHRLHGPAQNSA
jgi:hypothetical protein